MLPAFVTTHPAILQLQELGGVLYVVEQFHAGRTLADIARALGTNAGPLRRWIQALPPEERATVERAKQEGADGLVDEAKQIADALADEVRALTKPMYVEGQFVTDLVDVNAIVAADKECIRVRHWMAERLNREQWGPRSQTDVVVNFGGVYLDALRRFNSEPQPAPPIEVQTPVVTAPASALDFL